ncbi:carbohydrate ABC transporter permease [Streptacidiphilus sp. PB12-B1b]|uniref:carbohydrate ABC transporter permease n=1 Tax=Streptacidiphilus sp. PB12-B1b TaxID=2705012 RepID=UPI0015F80ADE|nr:carbohydrate ABC transporter permease [Streptacidiphilus sp. PB12-B1b]QMU74922.1 carbohydrate ABC transporter permease [Streptacidiphilus sp. PB12-B1b]
MATDTVRAHAAPKARPVLTQRKPPRLRTVVTCAAAYLIGVFFLLPYLEMVITALRPAHQMADRDLLPTSITFSNFTNIWSTGLGTNLGVSLEIAFGATALVLLVAIPAAYYTARRKFRGRGLFLLLVLVTQMFQPTAMIVGIYREFLQLNMTNSVWALILVNAGFNMAFAIWILNAYFSAIPKEIEEAAIVDGCTRIGALFRVIIPLSMPGIVTALIFTFIAAWNEFIVALTLMTTNQNGAPLTVKISTYVSQYSTDWGHLFAGSVIATIPVIILFALIEGKVVSGLTAGSVK